MTISFFIAALTLLAHPVLGRAQDAVLITKQKMIVTSASEQKVCGYIAGDQAKTSTCFPEDSTMRQVRGIYDGVIASDAATCGHDKTTGDWICWGVNETFGPTDFGFLKGAQIGDVESNVSNICRKAPDGFISCLNVPLWTVGGFESKQEATAGTSHKFGPFKNIRSFSTSLNALCVVDDDGVKCEYANYASHIPSGTLFTHPRLVGVSLEQICVVDDSGLRCFPQSTTSTIKRHAEWATARTIRVFKSGVCAVLQNGAVACDDPSAAQSNSFNIANSRPTTLSAVTDIEGNESGSACALESTGTVKCWGELAKTYGVPPELKKAVNLSVSEYHVCATDSGGSIVCWGQNRHGQLIQPLPAGSALQQAVGFGLSCTWNDKGAACSGDSSSTELLSIPAFNRVVDISIPTEGYLVDACAIDRTLDGHTSVKCWGSAENDLTQPLALKDPSMIATNGREACADSSDSRILCWGSDSFKDAPVKTRHLKKLALSTDLGCAVDDFGLVCWGPDAAGSMKLPDNLAMDGAVIDIAVGSSQACALTFDHQVQCWGPRSVPTPELRSPVLSVSSLGPNGMCATDQDGVKCWGHQASLPGHPIQMPTIHYEDSDSNP